MEISSGAPASSKLWTNYNFTSRPTINVSGIWKDHQTSPGKVQLRTEHHKISHESLRTSLANPIDGVLYDLRIIWVETSVSDRCHDIPLGALSHLVDLLDLGRALRDYEKSLAECSRLPATLKGTSTGYIGDYPNFLMMWSHAPQSTTTNILCMAQPDKIKMLTKLLDQDFIQDISGHRMIAPMLGAFLYSQEIDIRQKQVTEKLDAIDARNDDKNEKFKTNESTTDDLFQLSAQLSDYKLNVASWDRKIEIKTAILEFIRESLHDPTHDPQPATNEMEEQMMHNLTSLDQSTTSQVNNAEAVLNRVEARLQARRLPER